MKKKILIGDDAKTVRLVLHRILQQLDSDLEILQAGSGCDILDVYFAEEPDLILLDVDLPEVDGWEILRCIREVDTETKIVMITGSQTPEDVMKAVELGASAFVGKPFDREELAELLGAKDQFFAA